MRNFTRFPTLPAFSTIHPARTAFGSVLGGYLQETSVLMRWPVAGFVLAVQNFWRWLEITSGQGKKVEKICKCFFKTSLYIWNMCSLFMCLFWYTFLRWLSTCFFFPTSFFVLCNLWSSSLFSDCGFKIMTFWRPGHERHYPNHVPWISAATEEVTDRHWYLGRITTSHHH